MAEFHRWPEAVIFDLDGTLIDSAPDVAASLNEVLGRRGFAPFSVEAVATMIGGGIPELIRKALEAHGVEPDDIKPLVQDMVGVYASRATVLTVLYDGAAEMLAGLRDSGVKIGLCTNKLQDITDIILRDLDVAQYFGSVVGAAAGRPRKPDAAALEMVLNELDATAANAVMVGDSGADAGAAKNAGTALILADYGYCRTPLETFGPDATISGLRELPSALSRLAQRRSQ